MELVGRLPSQSMEEPPGCWARFFAHWKDQRFRERKGWQPQFSFWLQIPFRCLPGGAGAATSSRAYAGRLIRKSGESRSPHSSGIRLLDDHDDPQIAVILGFEIEVYIARKLSGRIYGSDACELAQNRNMLQLPPSVFSPAHLRFVAVVRDREENAR